MKKIILASSSPRRKDLLKNFGINFEVMSSEVVEQVRACESPEQIVMALAFQKAIDIANKIKDEAIIIAGDTIVYKNEVLGKPIDFENAMYTLLELQDSVHYVYSGLAVLDNKGNKKIVTYEKTAVKIKKLSKEEIKRYIESGEVWDKAGSYGIQGIGSVLVEWIQGDYFNVVGLPVSKLYDILDRHFNVSLI